jgi:hypothetical protein
MTKAFVLFATVSLVAFPVNAQPSRSKHSSSAKPTMSSVGGVEASAPQEATSKGAGGGAGWNGTYVGVNAGMGFGATAGTNVVVPFGTGSKVDK